MSLRVRRVFAPLLSALCAGPLGAACDDAAERGAVQMPEVPIWAVAAGADEFGTWAELELGGQRTRLRRVPKGTFLMGSAEDEAGRGPDELQHEVTLSHDYWLAESECTQRLWALVMEGNPSYFVSEERPVEVVTWPDVQEFMTRLNARVPGLDARLPTEAEWEYAARAGTTTVTYVGPLEVVGKYNAPILDEIAWYGGNSSSGFELSNGFDSSAWPEKQDAHALVGSHPVMRKQPNRFGLYDMLGNVWEWCEDWFGTYDSGPVVDPQGPGTGDARVIRGGSWFDSAIDMRVANRNQGTPEDKVIILGFRLASGVSLPR